MMSKNRELIEASVHGIVEATEIVAKFAYGLKCAKDERYWNDADRLLKASVIASQLAIGISALSDDIDD